MTPGPINSAFPGLTTFRGNATRDYYGEGPLPTHPEVLWRYPRTGGLCSSSNNLGQTKVWCGTGWTGQPNVIQHANGSIEVREGAYDDRYHFGSPPKFLDPVQAAWNIARMTEQVPAT